MSPITVRARLVVPVCGPPIWDGALRVEQGRIAALGEAGRFDCDVDLGNAAILPALVSAHTHLEYSDLAEPLGIAGERFSEWLGPVIQRRREMASRPDADPLRCSAVRLGLDELASTGCIACGEIASGDFPAEALERGPVCGVVFRELLGLDTQREGELLAVAQKHLQAADDYAARGWRVGLSPHAPYTASPRLVQEAASLSARCGAPVAMHLAESLEELELLSSHSGGLVERLRAVGAWSPSAAPPRGIAPLDYLEMLSAASRALVIHGNYLSSEEIAFLAAHRTTMSLVYCPRTHARFGHAPYPLAEMLAAGVHLALGTDSRATNPDLSLWEEMKFVVARGLAPPAAAIRMGTLASAQALGLDVDYGSLSPGKRAAIAVVPLADADGPDGHAAVFGQTPPVAPRLLVL